MKPDSDQREKAHRIYQKLIDHFGEPAWRNPLPPIDELVSTILSQNTNDLNRDKAFHALKTRFPDWAFVMAAPVEEVISAIQVAGLANSKGPRIQQVLHEIVEERGSLDLSFLESLPLEAARNWLRKFKGVGPKTAAIVLQFSLNRPAFPVDTHIYRVSGRLGLRPQTMNVEETHTWMEVLFKPEMFYACHLVLIQLGREICTARKAFCERCPLIGDCDYYQALIQN
jgi:endonuclease-3